MGGGGADSHRDEEFVLGVNESFIAVRHCVRPFKPEEPPVCVNDAAKVPGSLLCFTSTLLLQLFWLLRGRCLSLVMASHGLLNSLAFF